ncbi:aminotransferase class I/II-fold pyridoxal phosphate-dependent enzyme [Legionella norrlandica]|uniref:aminotransferase class I/II-fold pyridoxal phosphate-dependent enzyme n=1 Tax=Legionella norrlandica TaxID=1498499 RepID=UPI003B981AB7
MAYRLCCRPSFISQCYENDSISIHIQPCSIAQRAAVAALNGSSDSIEEMVNAFHQRHDYVADRLQSIDGIEVIPADGTFYIFQVCKLL